uniref:ZP domain-containing protein n=1 Tax=Heterorhabditis bacteriophora TaxID=37862 RepID=A0A1I7XRT5_HETBA
MGQGPFSPTVSSPVKIGDNISLVVKAKSEHSFDMFVHSCFASDGPGSKKIDLIDKNGCVSRPEFVSPLKRIRDRVGIMYYTFGPDDVYFSCSIDLTPLRNAPKNINKKQENKLRTEKNYIIFIQEICSTFRRIRSVSMENNLRLFDNVRVELAEKFEMEQRIGTDDEQFCLSSTLLTLVSLFFCTLLFAFTISTVTAMSLYFKLSSLRAKVY